MRKEYLKNLNTAIKRRKQQNVIDYEFKCIVKRENPYLYYKAACETREVMERKRIIALIRKKIKFYRECGKKTPIKSKYVYKILAMHDLIYALGEEGE